MCLMFPNRSCSMDRWLHQLYFILNIHTYEIIARIEMLF
jgi:hypothetical protein